MALLSPSGRLLQVNRALCELTGYRREQLLAGKLDELVHPDDLHLDRIERQRLRAGEIRSYVVEKRCYDAKWRMIWARFSTTMARDPDGNPRYLVVAVEDDSERKRQEDQLQRLADLDSLTGLLNRRRFEDELARRVAMTQRYGECHALLLVDLDRFKPINDDIGHDAGDYVLRQIGAALSERLRKTDLAARFGGDEFVVLVPHADIDHVRVLAQTLLDAIAEREMSFRGNQLRVTASIGVSLLTRQTATTTHEVMARADSAMYQAKRAGGNRWSEAAVEIE